VTTSTHRERPLPAVTCVGYFLVLLVITIVNVALPSTGDRIGAGIDGLQWAGVGSLALPAGRSWAGCWCRAWDGGRCSCSTSRSSW
jgi:hypothetical protein